MKPTYISLDGEKVEGWKTPYNHDTKAEAFASGYTETSPGKTQQNAKQETDINTIVDRFLKTGQAPQVAVPPKYGDFTTAEDFHDLQNHLAETNALFYKLPAAVRASYQNDAAQWVGDVNEKLQAGDLDSLRVMGLDIPYAPQAPPEGETKGETPLATPVANPPKTDAKAPV